MLLKELNLRWYSIKELQTSEEILELSNTGIYVMLCVPTNECYVGSTTRSFRERWKELRKHLRASKVRKISKLLVDYWHTYKESDFLFAVLEITYQTHNREQYWLTQLQPVLNTHTKVDPYIKAEPKLKVNKTYADKEKERCRLIAEDIKNKLAKIKPPKISSKIGKIWCIEFDDHKLYINNLSKFCKENDLPYKLLSSMNRGGAYYKLAGFSCYKI
jgi:group I intron endonuclease